MRFNRLPSDTGQSLGHVEPGKMFVMIDREDYWQCAFLIPKGAADEIRKRGIEKISARRLPTWSLRYVTASTKLRDWNDVSLLTVKVDRLMRWWRPRPSVVLAMLRMQCRPWAEWESISQSRTRWPQANILAAKLADGSLSDRDLKAVQRRREFPTRAMQRLQILITKRCDQARFIQ